MSVEPQPANLEMQIHWACVDEAGRRFGPRMEQALSISADLPTDRNGWAHLQYGS